MELSRRNVIHSIAMLFSGSAVAQGTTALALLLTARQLGAAGYGQYAASFVFSSLTSIGFNLGLDIWLLRQGGRLPQRLAELAGSVLGLKGIFGLIWLAIISVLAPSLHQDTYPVQLLHWSAILVWLDSLLATVFTAFKAVLRNKIPSLLEAGADLIWLLGVLFLMGWGNRQPVAYIQVRVLVAAPVLVLAGWLLWRLSGLRVLPAMAWQALRESPPFALSEFLGWASMRVDVFIVSLILGKTATGLYSPAVGLVNMAFLAPAAVYNVMVPVLSHLYQAHPFQARATARRAVFLSLALGLVLTLIFWVGAPLAVLVLGKSFVQSVGILRILSLVLFFKCLSFAMAAIIVATDQQARRTLVQAVAVAANVVLNLLVVSWAGIQGVAVVYVLTEVILLIGYARIAWRRND